MKSVVDHWYLPIKELIQRNEKIDTFELSGIIDNRSLK